jgi:hypothetical protein
MLIDKHKLLVDDKCARPFKIIHFPVFPMNHAMTIMIIEL